jgi:hypothetical protein
VGNLKDSVGVLKDFGGVSRVLGGISRISVGFSGIVPRFLVHVVEAAALKCRRVCLGQEYWTWEYLGASLAGKRPLSFIVGERHLISMFKNCFWQLGALCHPADDLCMSTRK